MVDAAARARLCEVAQLRDHVAHAHPARDDLTEGPRLARARLPLAFLSQKQELGGVEDGEAWSEGGQSDSAYTSALPAGRYGLRLEGQWEKWQQPATVSVRVEQNVVRGMNFLVALIVLSVVPVLMIVYHIGFERRRWSESMFGGGDSSDDDD